MTEPVVYFVEIGKHIKIGFTTNLKQRLKTFLTSSPDIALLLAIPGDRALERKIHDKLSDSHLTRELFRREQPVLQFIHVFEHGGLQLAFQYLEDTSPAARARRRVEDRAERNAFARRSRAEKDAYFASLVADRKNRLGW